jgi:hypothetical protein
MAVARRVTCMCDEWGPMELLQIFYFPAMAVSNMNVLHPSSSENHSL